MGFPGHRSTDNIRTYVEWEAKRRRRSNCTQCEIHCDKRQHSRRQHQNICRRIFMQNMRMLCMMECFLSTKIFLGSQVRRVLSALASQLIRLSRWACRPARTLGQAKYCNMIGCQSSEARTMTRTAPPYMLMENRRGVHAIMKDGSL